jgi:IS30 family transposase
MRVSHQTIYRSLFMQARGVLKKELMDHLRSKQPMRRSRHASDHGQSRGQIVDALSIRERPAEVEDWAIPGHGEGDLLSGAKQSYSATLVERHSRFVILIRLPSGDTAVVVAGGEGGSKHVRKLPATLRRWLTWDRGLEMAKQKDFTVATDVKVYFSDRRVSGNAARKKTPTYCCSILPARHRPVPHLSSAARPGLAAPESTSKKDSRISNSCE